MAEPAPSRDLMAVEAAVEGVNQCARPGCGGAGVLAPWEGEPACEAGFNPQKINRSCGVRVRHPPASRAFAAFVRKNVLFMLKRKFPGAFVFKMRKHRRGKNKAFKAS